MKVVHKTLALSLVAAAAAFCQPAMAQATIDQSKATTKGIGGGDSAGFPVTISQPGSYKLMSNLVVPSGSHAIEVTVPGVTIDLNGFTIAGGYACTGGWGAMTCTGSGRGIVGGEGVTVRNGFIKGFEHGVNLGERAVVDDVAVEGTYYGLYLGVNSHVRGVRVRYSKVIGIASLGGLTVDSTVSESKTAIAQYGGVIRGVAVKDVTYGVAGYGSVVGVRESVLLADFPLSNAISMGNNLCSASAC
jgi:hypothetical protein